MMAFWHFWQPSSNKLVNFIISCIFLYILIVENKFFFFFYYQPMLSVTCRFPPTVALYDHNPSMLQTDQQTDRRRAHNAKNVH